MTYKERITEQLNKVWDACNELTDLRTDIEENQGPLSLSANLEEYVDGVEGHTYELEDAIA